MFPGSSMHFGEIRRPIKSGTAWRKSSCLSPIEPELSIMKRRSTLPLTERRLASGGGTRRPYEPHRSPAHVVTASTATALRTMPLNLPRVRQSRTRVEARCLSRVSLAKGRRVWSSVSSDKSRSPLPFYVGLIVTVLLWACGDDSSSTFDGGQSQDGTQTTALRRGPTSCLAAMAAFSTVPADADDCSG